MDSTIAEYEQIRREATQLLREKTPQDAFNAFQLVLEYPGHPALKTSWRNAMEVFAQISTPIAGKEFADKIHKVAKLSPQAKDLFELSNSLLEESLFGIAATVLTKAYNLDPNDNQILAELIAALENIGCHEEACAILHQSHQASEIPFFTYLLAFNSLMTGDLEEPSQLLPSLQASDNPNQIHLADRIAGMLQRAEALKGISSLDQKDLQGWHVVINGSILLHASPYGREDGMHGRYAYIQDSYPMILEGIQRLLAVLETWGWQIPRIFVLPDRSSAILAHALAEITQAPLQDWPQEGTEAPGFLPVYDLTNLPVELLEQLLQRHTGQLLWSHASCWVEEPPFAPDLTTYLYQINVPAWEEGMGIDPTTQNTFTRPTDARSIAEIAQQIVQAKLDAEDLADLPNVINLAKAVQPLTGPGTIVAFHPAGQRQRQWLSSPVSSLRFL